MKKLGLTFVVFLCFSLFLVPDITFAQPTNGTVCDYSDSGTRDGIIQNGKCVSNGTYGEVTLCDYSGEGTQDGTIQQGRCVSNGTYGSVGQDPAILLNQGQKLFTDKVASLQTPATAGNVKLIKPGDPGYDYLVKTLQDAQTRFETYYINNKSTNQATAYKEGLLRARSYIQTQKTAVGRPNAFNQDPISNFVLQFQEVLLQESNKKDDVLFVQGQTGKTEAEAEALVNARIADAQARTKTAEERPDDVSECNWDSWTIAGCMSQVIAYFIKTVFLNIAGFFLWASANLLNYSIQFGILDFKSWAPDTLYPIWIVVRQIVSLFVVFAGLWLGLMYIIGKDETFEKYIPWVVIFALFVNFSYPLVRTAVDISNVISLNIYASAVGNDALTGTGNNTPGSLIMSRLGLQGLIASATETGGSNKDASNLVTGINSPAGALMAVAFVLYAAYIFFMITGIIIMRTISLIFLIIASPILFIDSVIPKLGDEAVKLRRIFFEQLAVGPVFMIMLALTLKFLGVFNLASGAIGTAGTSGAGTSQTIKEFFNIAMMLIMLHIMLKITKETAGGIGQMATNAMGKVGGFAGGMAMGGAGLLARGTVGRIAAKARDSKWVTNNQDGMLGRHAYNMSNSIAKSSFDARNSSYVQTGAKKLGLSMGMGTNTNYEKDLDSKIQDRKERYARIKTENADGTINEAGARARQKFFASQGDVGGSKFSKALGVVQNKNKVGEALINMDKEKAEAQSKKLAAYDKRSGEAKQEKFASETDQAMKQQMIESDRAKAEAENITQENSKYGTPIEYKKMEIPKSEDEGNINLVPKNNIEYEKMSVPTTNGAQKNETLEKVLQKTANDQKNKSGQSNTHDINAPLEFA